MNKEESSHGSKLTISLLSNHSSGRMIAAAGFAEKTLYICWRGGLEMARTMTSEKIRKEVVSTEQEIRDQYAKFFETNDWSIFKKAAEYYLENAARVLTSDIKYEVKYLKLLRRNVHKRLYIGIACELLLKSLFLKKGYCINTPKGGRKITQTSPYRLSHINRDDFDINDTFTFDKLMQSLYKICQFGSEKPIVDRGFRIAKVFRNKEGHVAVLGHNYEPQNYRDIEKALIQFYKYVFSENVKIRFSVGIGEKPEFEIKNNH